MGPLKVLQSTASGSNWNLEMTVVLCGGRKTGTPGEKPLRARTRTNNKLDPHTLHGITKAKSFPDKLHEMYCSYSLLQQTRGENDFKISY